MPVRRLLPLGVLMCVLLAGAPRAQSAFHAGLNYDIDSPPGPSPAAQNQLDLYTPDGVSARERRPLVVYVHGGGWAIGDKANQIQRKVGLFTSAGYVFASVNYRLSPNSGDLVNPDPNRVKFPDQPHDVGEAIGWLSRHVSRYGGDPSRIVLIGHSAGGQLVSLVSTNPRYISAYGVHQWQLIGTVSLDTDAYDVPLRIATGGPSTQSIFYNAFGTPAENAATNAWALASPIKWGGPKDPEFLIVTQAANALRAAEADRMAATLTGGSGASVFRAPYDHEGINSAVGDLADGSGETAAIMDFVARMVAAAKKPKARLHRHPPRLVAPHGRRTAVRFAFRSNVPGARFRCRVDTKKLKPCRSQRTFRVGAGRHRLRYRAISPRGRPGDVRRFKFRVGASR
ncbi:MAG: alpha/beta hydrolase [Solirubrobacterales bacterium]